MEANTQERQKAWSRYSRAGDDNSGVHRTSLIKQQASISWFQEWQIWSAHYLLQHRTEQSQTLVMRDFQWLSHIELLRACYYLYRTRIWLTNGATGPIPGDTPELCRNLVSNQYFVDSIQAAHFMIHMIHDICLQRTLCRVRTSSQCPISIMFEGTIPNFNFPQPRLSVLHVAVSFTSWACYSCGLTSSRSRVRTSFWCFISIMFEGTE